MRRKGFFAALIVGVAALAVAAFALAGGSGAGFNHLSEQLIGYQEVPALSTTGHATFTADVSKDGQSVDWQLSYADLEGTVTQSHIHFGQRSVNGAIIVFLCSNLGNGPAGTQACPAAPATISGTFDAGDVLCGGCAPAPGNPFGQGIGAGEFEELIRAIDAGKTYANVHTTRWPGGEIRAQLNETGNPHD
jgi:CHRD domain-containing protein